MKNRPRRPAGVIRRLPMGLFTIFFVASLLAGCGTKGPVRPLELRLPAAPQGLRVQQRGLRMLLSWAPPGRNQDGSPLEDLQGYRVYKMEYDPTEDCPECRDTSVLLQEVDLDYLRQARRLNGRLYLWDSGLEAGRGYQYRVVAYNRKGREGEPTQLRRLFFLPPTPPSELEASPHDRLVRLSWAPVEAAVGYNVYRRLPGEPFALEPINAELLAETGFEDFHLKNELTYIYAIRSVVERLDQRVESPLSASVEAVPRPGL